MSLAQVDSIYGAILALRAKEAHRLDLMPYQVLSDAIIRDLLKHKPQSIDTLKSTPSLAHLASESIGAAIVKLFAPPAPQTPTAATAPTTLDEESPKSSTVPAFSRKRGRGAKLAFEDDDELKAAPAPLDAPSLDSKELQIYESYQRDMKSVDSLRDALNEDVSAIQKKLLNFFCTGFPVQLSRLGITSEKVVYNALPTVLSLRQPGPLKLEQDDLTSGALSSSLRMLYPSASELAVQLALCEWYHDLHPDLQLNSARFVAPRGRTKRKEPTEAPQVEVSTPKQSSDITTAKRREFMTKSVAPRKSPRLTGQAKMLVSGFNRDHRQPISLDGEDDAEVDQDPSADYSNSTRPADLWRSQGPRPKKIAKRTSMDSLGFVSFQNNMLKERVALTDDDFSGTETAYFADAYSPSAKPPTSKLTASTSAPLLTPTKSSSIADLAKKRSDVAEETSNNASQPQLSDSGLQHPMSASTSNVSNTSSGTEELSSQKSAASVNYDGLSAIDIFDRFNRIRLAAASGAP